MAPKYVARWLVFFGGGALAWTFNNVLFMFAGGVAAIAITYLYDVIFPPRPRSVLKETDHGPES